MLRIGSAAVLSLALAGPCAAEELLAGRVQKVIQQPSGADGCPPPCPVEPETLPDGSRRICVSNGGGCEAMELKVERDFLGRRQPGSAWSVSKRVGEWGSALPVTSQLIVVHDDGTRLRWTPAVMRDGQVLVHPDRFVSFLLAVKREWFGTDTTGMVPVEQVVERLRSGK
ncbi:hypothetical protein LQ564_20055 [Massilia sp. G4R7]|uniref:Uncharacterized protein n=1 Tax=Massilia phyllostachyos TaxID=2898585 RepID=A0ABS8QA13_9BURK|nr:hypothetical protein [Massilia phyllostachyos]MCD2518595.1 hypothetical protein [Massilia phyllostachyos]